MMTWWENLLLEAIREYQKKWGSTRRLILSCGVNVIEEMGTSQHIDVIDEWFYIIDNDTGLEVDFRIDLNLQSNELMLQSMELGDGTINDLLHIPSIITRPTFIYDTQEPQDEEEVLRYYLEHL